MQVDTTAHKNLDLLHKRTLVLILSICVPLFLLAGFHHHLAFYYPDGVDSTSYPAEADFSALQAEALLHGHLEVRPTPTALMLLPNPYDPSLNVDAARAHGFHDLSYFNGKIYAPQGFGAAVLIDLPTRLLGLGYANASLKCLLLVLIGSVSLALLALFICDNLSPRRVSTRQTLLIALLTVGCNPATWLVVAGRAYQSTVAAGYMGMTTGLLVFVLSIIPPQPINRIKRFCNLAVSITLVSLAVVARPTLGPIAICSIASLLLWSRKFRVRRSFRLMDMCAILSPAMLLVVIWFSFNAARFGSVWSTGHKFQLAGFDMRNYPVGSVRFIKQNISAYLFTPFQWSSQFPYFRLAANTLSADMSVQSHETLVGLFTGLPVLVTSPVLLVIQSATRSKCREVAFWLGLMAGSLLSLLAVSLLFKDSTFRYVPDFAVPLVVLSAIYSNQISQRDEPGFRLGSCVRAGIYNLSLLTTFAIFGSILLTYCPGC